VIKIVSKGNLMLEQVIKILELYSLRMISNKERKPSAKTIAKKTALIFTLMTLALATYATLPLQSASATLGDPVVIPSNNLPGQTAEYTFKFKSSAGRVAVGCVLITAPIADGVDISAAEILFLDNKFRRTTALSLEDLTVPPDGVDETIKLDLTHVKIFRNTQDRLIKLTGIVNPSPADGDSDWTIELGDRNCDVITGEDATVTVEYATILFIDEINAASGAEVDLSHDLDLAGNVITDSVDEVDIVDNSGVVIDTALAVAESTILLTVDDDDSATDLFTVDAAGNIVAIGTIATSSQTITGTTPTLTLTDTDAGQGDASIGIDTDSFFIDVDDDTADGNELTLDEDGVLAVGTGTLTINGLTNTISTSGATLTLDETTVDVTGTLTVDTIDDSGAGTISLADDVAVTGTTSSTLDDATAAAVSDVLTIAHTTSGAPAAGIGTGLVFQIEDGGGAEEQASIDVSLSDVTEGSEDADLAIRLNDAGTITTRMTLTSDGVLTVGGTVTIDGLTNTISTSGTTLTLDESDIIISGVAELGSTELEIVTGTITPTRSYHLLKGEGGTADILTTIGGGVTGDILILGAKDDTVNITIDDEGDNIRLPGANADFVLDSIDDTIMLIFDGNTWNQIAQNDNGA